MEACSRQLLTLKALLHSFGESTGLKVNYNKSIMVPINLTPQKLQHLARTFSCATGVLPFTYLGLPLSLKRPTAIDFTPLVNKCEKRLAATSAWLNQAGRLEITNSVITTMPSFCMSTFLLQQNVIDKIDKLRKLCLWRGSDINARQKPRAAWKIACKEKGQGGLGILNIKSQNEALLIKHLHKFFNKENVPWVHLVWEKYYNDGKLPSSQRKGSFWCRGILKLLTKFKGMARVQPNSGKTCFLWGDLWGDETMDNRFPELDSFAKNKLTTLAEGYQSVPFHNLFHLPMSSQAHQQMLQLQQEIQQLQLNENADTWSYI